MDKKICTTCGVEKELTEENYYFRKLKWSNQCRACTIKKHREYNIKNRDRINEKKRESYKAIETKKKKQEYAKKYRQENKEKIKEQSKKYRFEHKNNRAKYSKEKRNNDSVFRLKDRARNVIRFCLNYKDKTKCHKTEELTKIAIEDLKEYLLKTFVDNYGYCWDGVENVEVDHIKPLCLAKTEEEVMNLCHYTNLQLLKSEDNIKKGTKQKMEVG